MWPCWWLCLSQLTAPSSGRQLADNSNAEQTDRRQSYLRKGFKRLLCSFFAFLRINNANAWLVLRGRQTQRLPEVYDRISVADGTGHQRCHMRVACQAAHKHDSYSIELSDLVVM